MAASIASSHLLAVNLNAPSRYLHWSVLTISVSNLVLVVVMLAIFVAALLIPFPRGEIIEQPERRTRRRPDENPHSWIGRVRAAGLRWLPPDRLLPEHQPSFVTSWIYVFGVASLAALAIAIISGILIALGGVDWWHTNPVGHFFNSLHLWSVELFMAFMVIHLWGKFFMAAWRGGRARTWITGVLAFIASIGEAFTGYLTQQNFDSQWIATNGKDAFNATGIGGLFNLMSFGQMLTWHVVLMPLLLLAVVGLHILFVRYRGVVPPLPHGGGEAALRRSGLAADSDEWRGPVRRYDLAREGVAAVAVVVALTVALAGILSSPDVPPITVRQWANADAADFLGTAATELAGTSLTATYGPPYNDGTAAVQRLGVSWQKLGGVHQRVDAARAFVIDPLSATAAVDPALHRALVDWQAAPMERQTKWAKAYADAAAKVTFTPSGHPILAAGDYGPVPILLSSELVLARSGALDASLIANHAFYGTNFTKPLLFLEDGGYYAEQAKGQHLQGNQWGVMNETGSYPGQPWLWLYQLWYHLPGFDHSANVDLIAIYLTGLATLLLLLVPFIPGLRSIPRLVPIHRLVWREYYKDRESAASPTPSRAKSRAAPKRRAPRRSD